MFQLFAMQHSTLQSMALLNFNVIFYNNFDFVCYWWVFNFDTVCDLLTTKNKGVIFLAVPHVVFRTLFLGIEGADLIGSGWGDVEFDFVCDFLSVQNQDQLLMLLDLHLQLLRLIYLHCFYTIKWRSQQWLCLNSSHIKQHQNKDEHFGLHRFYF